MDSATRALEFQGTVHVVTKIERSLQLSATVPQHPQFEQMSDSSHGLTPWLMARSYPLYSKDRIFGRRASLQSTVVCSDDPTVTVTITSHPDAA